MEPSDSSHPAVLLRHDGELSDIRQLLRELEANCVETSGHDSRSVDASEWDLVIASPHRMPDRHPAGAASRPRLIAVVESDSRTMRAHLERMSVDMIVRRPVHPAALRLLILHTLYRGPERRRRQRVSIGAEVRLRSGLLRRTGTLTDLSLRGCRVQSRKALQPGQRIRLLLPARVTAGRPLRLTATAMRCGPAADEVHEPWLAALRFDDATREQTQRLQRIIEAHQGGPAVLRDSPRRRRPDDEPAGSDLPRTTAEPEPQPGEQPEERPKEQPERSEPIDDPQGPNEPSGADRRESARHSYSQRVVALGEQATRVLLGRDISLGGMRIDPNPSVRLGDRLQIALHAMARSEPLVVRAQVQRDDGERGLVLRFDELCERESEELSKLIAHLPVLTTDPGAAEDEESGMVISEILDCRAG